MTTLHPTVRFALASTLAAFAAPTLALAGAADAPIPCDEAPAGCVGSAISIDAWGNAVSIGTGSDLGNGSTAENVGGGYTEPDVGIGGREREIDQYGALYLLGTDPGTGEKAIYGFTQEFFSRLGSKDVYSLLLTHVEYLPAARYGGREVVEADLDGDGTLDLVVGDPGGSCGSGGTGRLLVFFDLSEVHDARMPEATICGLPGQHLGSTVNSNRKHGPEGIVTIPYGSTTYEIDTVMPGTFTWLASYPTY